MNSLNAAGPNSWRWTSGLLDAARTDPDLEVRKQAVLALSQFTTALAVSALDSIVRTGTDSALVVPAVVALAAE